MALVRVPRSRLFRTIHCPKCSLTFKASPPARNIFGILSPTHRHAWVVVLVLLAIAGVLTAIALRTANVEISERDGTVRIRSLAEAVAGDDGTVIQAELYGAVAVAAAAGLFLIFWVHNRKFALPDRVRPQFRSRRHSRHRRKREEPGAEQSSERRE